MSRFLRLTNTLVNVNQIRFIDINPDEYKIKLISSNFRGVILFGSGNIESDNTRITITKKENLEDYTIVSDWLLSEKFNNVDISSLLPLFILLRLFLFLSTFIGVFVYILLLIV